MAKNVDDNLIYEDDEQDEQEKVLLEQPSSQEEDESKKKKQKVTERYMYNAFVDMLERFFKSYSKEVSKFDNVNKTYMKETIVKYAHEIAAFEQTVKTKRHYSVENIKKDTEDITTSYLVITYEDLEKYATVVSTHRKPEDIRKQLEEGTVLIELIEEDVDLFLDCARVAVGKLLNEVNPTYYETVKDQITVGISGYPKLKEIPEFSVKDQNKIYFMEGDVINTDGSVVPKVTARAWECENEHTILVDIDRRPKICNYTEGEYECRGKIIGENKKAAASIDSVGFTFQQKNERAIDGNAQTIECVVYGYERTQMFLNGIQPGTPINLDGIFRVDYFNGKRGVETRKYIEVTSFRKQKDSELFKKDPAIASLVAQIPADPEAFYRKLVNSVAPNIFGRKYKRIKEAVLMVTLGNIAKKDFTGSRYRGDVLLLLVGSPSSAKSEIMNWVRSVDPRARYASSLSSKMGFTVGAILSEDTRRLSYGIIPLAHKGTALLDEIDKLNHEAYNAIIECTDDNQILNYNKAGFSRRIFTRCAHIHACNSNKNDGNYNPYLPFYEQVALPSALLSRYDLVFVVHGLDEDEDDALVDHFRKLDSTLMPENDYDEENIVKGAIDSQNMDVFDKKFMIHFRDYFRSIPANKRPQLIAGSEAWEMLQRFIIRYKNAKHLKFLDDPDAVNNPDLIDLRKRRTGRNIAEIIALIMRDSDKVEPHHMEKAIHLMETALASLIPKSREASEEDLENTTTGRNPKLNFFDKLTIEAKRELVGNLRIKIAKYTTVKDVIHNLAKTRCANKCENGRFIETTEHGNKETMCNDCEGRGWYYSSITHNELISFILDSGKCRTNIYPKELETILKNFLERDEVKFIKVVKGTGSSIRYMPTMKDLNGVQAREMLLNLLDPLKLITRKSNQGTDEEQKLRGPNVIGISKSANMNKSGVDKWLEENGYDIKSVSGDSSLDEDLEENGIDIKNKKDVGEFL